MATDWTDTIKARDAGLVEGFHGSDTPVEKRDAAGRVTALADMKRDDLYEEAQRRGVDVPKRATRDELIAALEAADDEDR